MRMEDDRLPKRVLLGTLATGKGYRGGQESDWVSHLGEDLVAFGMEDEKDGEKWKKSALEPGKWFVKIEDGAARFMRKWHAREAEASAKRQLARAEVAAAAAAETTAATRPTRKRSGGVAAAMTAPARPKRQRNREAMAEAAAATAGAENMATTGPENKRNGGAQGDGKKTETAVEAARAAEAALVAKHVPD